MSVLSSRYFGSEHINTNTNKDEKMKIKIPALIKKTNPKWAKKILTRDTFEELRQECEVDGRLLDISCFESCIVGETLNLFDTDYHEDFNGDELDMYNGCSGCVAYSRRFYDIISSNSRTQKQKLEIHFKRYAEHLKSKHKSIVEQLK